MEHARRASLPVSVLVDTGMPVWGVPTEGVGIFLAVTSSVSPLAGSGSSTFSVCSGTWGLALGPTAVAVVETPEEDPMERTSDKNEQSPLAYSRRNISCGVATASSSCSSSQSSSTSAVSLLP